MKITSFLKELDISKWSAIWAFLTDGWAGLAKLICTAFTNLLHKADRDKLKKYAELASKVAVFLRGIIETFIESGAVRDAAMKTADSVAALAEHLADGEYTTDELDVDVDNVVACVEAWKKAADNYTELSTDKRLAVSKVDRKCDRKIAKKCGAFLAFIALSVTLCGCLHPEGQPSRSQSQNNNFDRCVVVIAANVSVSNETVIAQSGDGFVPSEIFTQTMKNEGNEQNSPTMTPTQSTDVSPKTDVNTTGGRTAGVLESLLGSFGAWLTTPSGQKSVSNAASVDCSGGACSDGACSDGACSDGGCADGSCSLKGAK